MYSIKTGEYEVLANGSVSFFDPGRPISVTVSDVGLKKLQVNFSAKKASIVNEKDPPTASARRIRDDELNIIIPYDTSSKGEGSTESPIDIGQIGERFLYLQFKLSVSTSGHLLLFFTFYGQPIDRQKLDHRNTSQKKKRSGDGTS